MKKFLSCLLAVLLLASISVLAFAEASPAQPTKVAGADEEGNEVEVTITPEADIESLPEAQQTAFKEAAEKLEAIEDLKAENADVAKAAGDNDVTLGGLFFVTAESFPAILTVDEAELATLIGAWFYPADGGEAIFIPVVDGKITFPGEGTAVYVYVVVGAPG